MTPGTSLAGREASIRVAGWLPRFGTGWRVASGRRSATLSSSSRRITSQLSQQPWMKVPSSTCTRRARIKRRPDPNDGERTLLNGRPGGHEWDWLRGDRVLRELGAPRSHQVFLRTSGIRSRFQPFQVVIEGDGRLRGGNRGGQNIIGNQLAKLMKSVSGSFDSFGRQVTRFGEIANVAGRNLRRAQLTVGTKLEMQPNPRRLECQQRRRHEYIALLNLGEHAGDRAFRREQGNVCEVRSSLPRPSREPGLSPCTESQLQIFFRAQASGPARASAAFEVKPQRARAHHAAGRERHKVQRSTTPPQNVSSRLSRGNEVTLAANCQHDPSGLSDRRGAFHEAAQCAYRSSAS